MKYIKNNLLFIAAFPAAILIFLGPIIFMKSSFLAGDSFVQFYPWLKCYSASIKNFAFPYWVKAMGSGFPLMAEGQVGGFYPLNIIMFFVLPFKVAYNYSVILHFVIGGIFTYMYARKIKMDGAGGCLSALLFCFGSAYAGCFYNIVSLRTLAWFPFVLFLFEKYFDQRGQKYIFFSGIVLALQLLAGFVQMAAYSGFFYLAYFVYRSLSEKTGLKKLLSAIAVFFITAFVVALPQIALTYQLSALSGREHATLGFVLWRSFLPTGLLGIVFPYSLSSSNAHFYIGILSILFVIFSFFAVKKDKIIRAVVLVLLLSLFFAVGWLNPLYIVFLKITGFFFFRNPSKFLFFAAFALAILAGYGFTKFFESGDRRLKEKAALIFKVVLSAAAFLFLAIKILLAALKKPILDAGYYLVKNFIYNKPHHRYSLDYYTGSVKSLYENMAAGLSFSNIFVISSWIFVIASFLLIPFLLKKRLKILTMFIIFMDIFVFGFYGIGFGGNAQPFSSIAPNYPKILSILKNDKDIFRILPFGLKSQNLPNWSLPNANILYGVDSAACYTPLATKRYKRALSDLEIVDDSLGLDVPAEGSISKNIDLIRLLNVKFVVTNKPLNESFLEEVISENGIMLYKIKNYMHRVFFSDSIDKAIEAVSAARFKVIRYKDGLLDLEAELDNNGFIIFSENYYPGWHVYVDGQEKDLISTAGLLQGVSVQKGNRKIRFIYKPYSGLFKK